MFFPTFISMSCSGSDVGMAWRGSGWMRERAAISGNNAQKRADDAKSAVLDEPAVAM
jgi:hypothetical protein